MFETQSKFFFRKIQVNEFLENYYPLGHREKRLLKSDLNLLYNSDFILSPLN